MAVTNRQLAGGAAARRWLRGLLTTLRQRDIWSALVRRTSVPDPGQFACAAFTLEYSQILNQPNGVTARRQLGLNLHALILGGIPYGVINRDYLSQGLIEIDDPEFRDGSWRPPLYWYFGGFPYEIDRALRVNYSYSAPFSTDSASRPISSALFIGYQRRERRDITRDVPKRFNQAVGELSEDTVAGIYRRFSRLADAIPFSAENVTDFDNFIRINWPKEEQDPGAKYHNYDGKSKQWTFESTLVELDGPARDSSSTDPFPYSLATLPTAPEKYQQPLLQWFFGGRHYSISKAMRVEVVPPSRNRPGGRALFIGYQGPGGY
jgi:hypothetical protein